MVAKKPRRYTRPRSCWGTLKLVIVEGAGGQEEVRRPRACSMNATTPGYELVKVRESGSRLSRSSAASRPHFLLARAGFLHCNKKALRLLECGRTGNTRRHLIHQTGVQRVRLKHLVYLPPQSVPMQTINVSGALFDVGGYILGTPSFSMLAFVARGGPYWIPPRRGPM